MLLRIRMDILRLMPTIVKYYSKTFWKGWGKEAGWISKGTSFTTIAEQNLQCYDKNKFAK